MERLLSNRYELLEKIGEGGMGIVYKARCTLLNRLVAVKILKEELNNSEDFMARFKREANSIASSSHPNIVSIYDVGSDKNINYIVMEYVNGKTLKQTIKENVRLNSLKTLDIALQIAKALECAHKNNIIHRDIKSDNILISEDNIVKLTDFGIAKVLDSATITNPNKIIGSVHYFSPEQAKGKLVDWRTDIYALGIVMYEMITGQVPYNAELPISVAMMHIQQPVTPPKEVLMDIPENINLVILKALEKEPVNRFKTATELANILNLIKNNPDLKVDFTNRAIDSTVVMDQYEVSCDKKIDPTFVMTQILNPETSMIKKDREKVLRNKNISNIKKTVTTIGLIILAITFGIVLMYISKGSSDNAVGTELTPIETSVSEADVIPLEVEKNVVPLLIGNTKDIAEGIVVNNEFLLGNIIYEYSDTVPNDLIISQSPVAGIYYTKNEKIDLVISQGPKVTSVIKQTKEKETRRNEKGTDKKNEKAPIKKKKN